MPSSELKTGLLTIFDKTQWTILHYALTFSELLKFSTSLTNVTTYCSTMRTLKLILALLYYWGVYLAARIMSEGLARTRGAFLNCWTAWNEIYLTSLTHSISKLTCRDWITDWNSVVLSRQLMVSVVTTSTAEA